MHSFHIIEEIVSELGYVIKMMAGATSNHVTFFIHTRVRPAPMDSKLFGSCTGSWITLGIAAKASVIFDLHDPESILKIKEVILSGKYVRGS